MTPKNNAIELKGVCYSAGRSFEIRDLTLNVPYGSIYGFLGPNGSGKTTTIRLFTGMHRATRGEISVLGHPIPKSAPKAMARTGYVPEAPHLYTALTVDESLRYHASFFPTWDEKWAEELLNRLRLDHDQRVGQLSKGETGKLLMLLALAQKPDLLVLDEPTDGLDPVVRRDVLRAVLDYVSVAGRHRLHLEPPRTRARAHLRLGGSAGRGQSRRRAPHAELQERNQAHPSDRSTRLTRRYAVRSSLPLLHERALVR